MTSEKKTNKFKTPWGILSGISLILCSFAVVAVVAVKVISYLMIKHSGGDDGLGNSWWITPLIILAVLLFIAFATCLVFYFLSKKKKDVEKPHSTIKRSVLVLVTSYVFTWFIVASVAGGVMNGYKQTINNALNLSGTREEILDSDEEIDSEYFKSSFVKSNNGDVSIVTDPNGYTHQEYDDQALRNATKALAEEVQREGSTLLWNNNYNGLPLGSGNKVSLFSHSSVDWLESGGGSGASQVNGNYTLYNVLTEVGLSINKTLWDYYNGLGSEYVRVGNVEMNEVPWNAVKSAAGGSFGSYGDAAIIVISRNTREASTGGNGGDATKSLADTPTGDYFDFSPEEEQLLNGVLELKENGTFKKVIVLLNTPTGVFMDTLVKNQSKIDACLWVGFTGYQGIKEVADLIVGNSYPTGHLPDTFLYNTSSAPSSVNVEAKLYTNAATAGLISKERQGAYLTYAENIYVGYKYFETRYEDTVYDRYNASSTEGVKNSTGAWKYNQEVAFPFGYGASYTTFEFSDYDVVKNADGDYDVTVTVTNTGDKPGKEVAQIYVQKPYTQYDKDYNIEQSSVNLAGYAKTNELQPGESQTLNITVRDDAFKTYDAYNKKTYIREKTNGDDAYYIALGSDSHDAINNILAAKGKTVANSDGVMDKDGNASFVKKFTFDEDDFSTYSISEQTGLPITNQFDDVDWNIYKNKSENNITYLSRKDWKNTYPKATVELSLTPGMVEDLAYEHDHPADPNDEMPTYGKYTPLTLSDLIGADYNDPRWDELLDYLTIDEQIKLLGNASFGTIALPKIGKTSDIASDGPLGLSRSMTYTPSVKTMSFPSTTLLAASFNDDLAYRFGELMGEDALHSGVTGLYAPGVNTHRSTYGARNWEYHSEDSFLAGIIAKQRVMGSQSKGCYVNLKHFALNDQESYRHGVNIWANEQSIREIYLNAYEYASTEGKATGFMSAFTRFGTKWSGAHKGLCTGVVRNEWGVKGFILSDSAWQSYMGVIDGVMAGNDCILYNVDLAMYDVAKTNATIAKAVRESTHRILYVIANSNAMNGISSNVRIYEVNEWWQILLTNVQTGILVAAIALAIITILTFIFYKPICKENKLNKERKEETTEANVPKEKQTTIKKLRSVFDKHKFKIFLLSSIGLTLIISTITGVAVMKDLFPNYDQTVSLREDIEGQPIIHKLEAEDANIDTTIVGLDTSTGISGIENDGSLTITFDFASDIETKAVLGLSFKKEEESAIVSQMYSFKFNGKTIASRKISATVPAKAEGDESDWIEVDLTRISLRKGLNSIQISKLEECPNYLDIDYAYLYVDANILFDTREKSLYRFDCNDGLDPFIEDHGGSVVDPDYTYYKEGAAGLYRYGGLNGAVMTSTVVVEEDAIAILHTIGDCRPGKTFSFASSGSNPYIASLSINGEENTYTPSTKSYPSLGWNVYSDYEIATIYLPQGENVIQFTIGGDNVNICGLVIASPVNVKLKNQAEDVPPVEPATRQKLEVEDAQIDTDISALGIGYENKTAAETNYPSGSGFIYNVNKAGSATITFHFNSSKATTALFGGCFGRREYERTINDMYNISVNGLPLDYGTITISTMKEGGVKYYDWHEEDISNISLNEGANTITLTKVPDSDKILNLDYIYLDTESEIEVIKSSDVTTYRFDTNMSANKANENNECNPFAAMNDGSHSDTDGNYLCEFVDSGIYRYGACNNAIFAFTLNLDKDDNVTIFLINDCRPAVNSTVGASMFSYIQQPQTNDRANPYIKSSTINGGENGVGIIPSTKSYASQGWNKFMDCELGIYTLKQGNNKITIEIGGDNINVCGVVVTSSANIKLGNH